ncbi:MAG: tetratricopeptide repeat protein [Cyclobacteriaceae bacterium]|nr:tetratricopeptide repeat protein [Cyclobacteriaceae bacterium]
MGRKATVLIFVFLALASGLSAQSKKHLAWTVEGDTLYNRGEYAEAARWYTKVLDANPPKSGKYSDRGFYGILYRRAVCYYSTEEFEKALADLAVFEPQFPRSPQPKLLKAFIYREQGDTDKQLENLTAAMELQLPNADFLKWRGLLLVQKERYDEARSDLLEARALSDDAEVETYLGLCYHHTGDADSAYLSFNKAIELNPTFLGTYLYAGSAALASGDYTLSLEYLNLALRIDSKNPDVLFYKGVALVELKQLDEACRCLNRAFYSGADDAGDYLAQYCFGSGN